MIECTLLGKRVRRSWRLGGHSVTQRSDLASSTRSSTTASQPRSGPIHPPSHPRTADADKAARQTTARQPRDNPGQLPRPCHHERSSSHRPQAGEPSKDHRTSIRVTEVSQLSTMDIDADRPRRSSGQLEGQAAPSTYHQLNPAFPKRRTERRAEPAPHHRTSEEEPINNRSVTVRPFGQKCVSRRSENSYLAQWKRPAELAFHKVGLTGFEPATP